MASKSPHARKKHREIAQRLTAEGFAERARLSEDEIAALEKIASGKYVRNAASTLKAIEFKAAYAYGRPVQAVQTSGDMTVRVVRE